MIEENWTRQLRILKTIGPRMAREKGHPHYKTAALLILLDMVDEGACQDGEIAFSAFRPRFEALLEGFAHRNARMPFFHFAQVKNQIWDLEPAPNDPAGVNKKTRATVRRELLCGLFDRQSREEIRGLVLGILASDEHELSRQLLETYCRTRWALEEEETSD